MKKLLNKTKVFKRGGVKNNFSKLQLNLLFNLKILKMKKLFMLFFAFSLFAFNNVTAQTIVAEIKGEDSNFIIDKDELSDKWGNYIINQGIDNPQLVEFKILKTEKGEYYLVCKDTTERPEGFNAYGVVLKQNGSKLEVSGGSTCICTGCESGCYPEYKQDNVWICTDCLSTPDKCKKSVTATNPNNKAAF